MLTLKSLPAAERFVKQQQKAGNDCYWDGWDIVFHKPNPRAVMSVNGAYRKRTWGFENRFVVTEEGTWQIDGRNIRRIPRTRN